MKKRTKAALAAEVQAALKALRSKSTARDRQNLARFGIGAKRFFGVSI